MIRVLVFLAGMSTLNGALARDCLLLADEVITKSVPSAQSNSANLASRRLQGETFLLTYRFEPQSPAIGEQFAVIGRVCRVDGAEFSGSVKVDATMPRHGHGMNYLPSTQMFSNGQFISSGLLLHMPGDWEVALKVADGDRRERLHFEYQAER